MNLLTIRSLCLSLTALSLAPLAAQGNTRTFAAVRTSSYGIPFWAGGSTVMRGGATVTTPATLFGATTLAASASNTARVHLFGLSAEAAAMVADFRANHAFVGLGPNGAIFQNTSTGSLVVRLAGNTVVSSTSTSANQGGNLTANVFAGDGAVYNLSLLGFGVRVRGNILARAQYSLTPTFTFQNGMAVDLNGPLRASGVGSAGASVSALGATVGTAATLVYADTNGTVALRVTPANATGTINFTVLPIRLVLSVFASLSLPFLPTVSATQTLFNYAAAQQAGVLNLSQV